MLSIHDLSIVFPSPEGPVTAVNKVSFTISEEQKVALIGETGCGKTVLGLAIMRLLPRTTVIKGRIIFQDTDLLTADESVMQKMRGDIMTMIMQNPSLSLNPVIKIGDQISEKVMRFTRDKKKARDISVQYLTRAGLADPSFWSGRYPHELSGGMKQRVMIAMALSSSPSLMIADEPTKSLDNEAREGIISLLREETKDTSLLLITHDIVAAKRVCNSIFVMYAGEIVESGPSVDILDTPKHPYTIGFIKSMPRFGLCPIDGTGASLVTPPSGCRFHPRCPSRTERCTKVAPPVVTAGHSRVTCWRYA